jgi:translation initiation factor IF-3
MKYRPKIGSGDFDTKTRQVSKFLGDGHKVKITIMFRGREMSHPELGKRLLDQVAEQVSSFAKVEVAPKLDGRNMIMVLAPDRRAAAQHSQQESQSGRTAQNGQTGQTGQTTQTAPAAATSATQTRTRTRTRTSSTPAPAAAAAAVTEDQRES